MEKVGILTCESSSYPSPHTLGSISLQERRHTRDNLLLGKRRQTSFTFSFKPNRMLSLGLVLWDRLKIQKPFSLLLGRL